MDTIRVLVGVLGTLVMVGGLVGVVAGAWAEGLWAAVAGGVVLMAVVLERARYQSEAAERSRAETGPGGGEPTVPVAPFRPTDEIFIDPTTGHRLRVYLDPTSGERRYHAEEVRPGG